MDGKDLNIILNKVIDQARDIKIPVSSNISEEIIINNRPKKRYGCCRKKDGKFFIEISSFILNCPIEKIKEIIAHEVLHTCYGCYEHGEKWKHYALRMNNKYGYNIKRTASFAELGLEEMEKKNYEDRQQRIKYIIKCKKCGKEYPRERYTCIMKKINAYRCNCGGKLIVIEKNNRR